MREIKFINKHNNYLQISTFDEIQKCIKTIKVDMNKEYEVKIKKSGLYLIIFTARISAVDKVSSTISILKNNISIVNTAVNPTFFYNKYEETATISTITDITTEDVIKFSRSHALDNNTQANIVLLRLKA